MHSTFGRATKVRATPSQHASLVAALDEISRLFFNVPGFSSYVLSTVPAEPDVVFITEFWDQRQSQQSAFAMAGLCEVAARFQRLAAAVEQHELQPRIH